MCANMRQVHDRVTQRTALTHTPSVVSARSFHLFATPQHSLFPLRT